MFSVYQEPVKLILDSEEVQGGERVIVDHLGQFPDGQEPAELILDSSMAQQWRGFASPFLNVQEPVELILDSGPTLHSDYMCVSQLGWSQEYSQTLKRAARSITQDLQSFDSLSWEYTSSAPPSEFGWSEEWTAFCLSLIEPNLCAPSLHLPYRQASPYFVSIQDDIWAYVTSIARKACFVLYHKLSRCKRELRRINAVVAILRKVAFSGVSFFCSVRWERRSWFLRHGAHPPKQTVQAILSLRFPRCVPGLLSPS